MFFLYANRFGRRKIIVWSFLLAAVGAIGALLLTDKAEHDKGFLCLLFDISGHPFFV